MVHTYVCLSMRRNNDDTHDNVMYHHVQCDDHDTMYDVRCALSLSLISESGEMTGDVLCKDLLTTRTCMWWWWEELFKVVKHILEEGGNAGNMQSLPLSHTTGWDECEINVRGYKGYGPPRYQ